MPYRDSKLLSHTTIEVLIKGDLIVIPIGVRTIFGIRLTAI